MVLRVTKFGTLIIMLMLLMSCTSTGKKIISSTDNLILPNQAILELEELKQVEVAMNSPGYNGDQLAQSMHQANLNAAMAPGNAAGAGLAGALIGGGIVQSISQNAAQKEKNNRIPNLLKKISQFDWQVLAKHSKLATEFSIAADPEHAKNEKIPYLLLTPRLEVSADYRTLQMTFLVEMYESQRKPVYRNYFHLQSQPLLMPNESLSQLDVKDEDWILNQILGLTAPLPELISNDLADWRNRIKTTSIRFKSELGEYYERGTILEIKDGFITFKTLRGEIKRYPCTQVLG